MAPDLPTLLRDIDGRKTIPRGFTLHTAGDPVVTREMGFFTRLLASGYFLEFTTTLTTSLCHVQLLHPEVIRLLPGGHDYFIYNPKA